MTVQEIEEILSCGIAEIMSVENKTVAAATSLQELGIDSLGLVEIFVFIEKKFKLKLLESGLTKEDIKTVRSLAAYISKRI